MVKNCTMCKKSAFLNYLKKNVPEVVQILFAHLVSFYLPHYLPVSCQKYVDELALSPAGFTVLVRVRSPYNLC